MKIEIQTFIDEHMSAIPIDLFVKLNRKILRGETHAEISRKQYNEITQAEK